MIRFFGAVQGLKNQPQGLLLGLGEYGTAGQAQVLENYTIGTSNGVVGGTMTNLAGSSLGNGTPTNGVQSSDKFDFDILLPSNGYMTTATKIHQTLTNLIAGNLVSGVTIPELTLSGTATIESLGGRTGASGSSVTTDSSGYITISGLSFTPSVVAIWMPGRTDQVLTYLGVIYTGGTFHEGNSSPTAWQTNEYVSSGGFKIKYPQPSTPVNWLAIE